MVVVAGSVPLVQKEERRRGALLFLAAPQGRLQPDPDHHHRWETASTAMAQEKEVMGREGGASAEAAAVVKVRWVWWEGARCRAKSGCRLMLSTPCRRQTTSEEGWAWRVMEHVIAGDRSQCRVQREPPGGGWCRHLGFDVGTPQRQQHLQRRVVVVVVSGTPHRAQNAEARRRQLHHQSSSLAPEPRARASR